MLQEKILEDLGYDLEMFLQKQIDSIVQRIKSQAQTGYGFKQGENRTRRKSDKLEKLDTISCDTQGTLERVWNEVKYLRQEVEFIKKIVKTENVVKRKLS